MKTAITQNISWQLLIYDRSELYCKVTKFMCGFEDPTYLVVYMFWTKLVLVELGPYISIAILNTALVSYQCQAGPATHQRAGPHRPKVVPSSPTECGSHEKGGEHDDHPLRDRHPLHHLPEHKARPGCVWGLQLLWTPRVTFSKDNLSLNCLLRGPPVCWQDTPALILKMSWLAHLALSINSSTNFLVYVFWGTKFRKAFCKAKREFLQQLTSVFPNMRNTNEK